MALRDELTEGLWWINFLQFWGYVGDACMLQYELNALNLRWNLMRAMCKASGRPRGARNKKGTSGAPEA